MLAWLPIVLTALTLAIAFWLRRTGWARPALWVSRLAFGALVLQGPLYFVARGGLRAWPPLCEWTFGYALAAHSLTNYKHIVLFALFFLLTYAHFRDVPRPMVWSSAVTVAMGLVVELAQGVSGEHHCRMRDLVPDSVGVIAGLAIVYIVRHMRRFSARDTYPPPN